MATAFRLRFTPNFKARYYDDFDQTLRNLQDN